MRTKISLLYYDKLGRDSKISLPAKRLIRRSRLAKTPASFLCRRVLAFEIDPRAECVRPAIFICRSGGPTLGFVFSFLILAPGLPAGYVKDRWVT